MNILSNVPDAVYIAITIVLNGIVVDFTFI